MSLSSLIRGNSANRGLATAIPAIPAISATDAHETALTVARIATVAVAKPRKPENEKPPEPARRQPTGAEVAELRALIRACGEPYGFTEADYQEAITRALADVDAALVCYRALAKVERVNVAARPEADDDRVTCRRCANLNEFETCRVAHPWTPATACAPARKPVVDLLRRCDGFVTA